MEEGRPVRRSLEYSGQKLMEAWTGAEVARQVVGFCCSTEGFGRAWTLAFKVNM